jgi:putative tryptophan/tyrosine transport system substrate-binding protein
MIQLQAGGLVIGPDTLFPDRSEQLAAIGLRYRVPSIFEMRQFVAAGGLASYSGSLAESYRLVGVYAGRVLKGENPSELPVQRASKVEMFLNLKTANALGVTIPLPLLASADEVIE